MKFRLWESLCGTTGGCVHSFYLPGPASLHCICASYQIIWLMIKVKNAKVDVFNLEAQALARAWALCAALISAISSCDFFWASCSVFMAYT